MPPLLYYPWTAPPVTAAKPPMSHSKATITLVPGGNPFDQREIVLQPGVPVIIGRSSKSEPKNLSPGTNNALFENPVISRKHARLELGARVPGQITVTDMHSMHGTSVNGQKLRDGEPHQLRSGDSIKLGDTVVRSFDVHDGLGLTIDITGDSERPANINTIHPRLTTSKTFTVPDIDDSDYDSETSKTSDDNVVSSAQTTPEQANGKTGSQRSPIDVDKQSVVANDSPKDKEEEVTIVTNPWSCESVVPDTYNTAEPTTANLHKRAFCIGYESIDEQSDRDVDAPLNELDYDDEEGRDAHDLTDSDDNASDIAEVETDSVAPESDEEEAPEIMSSKREPSAELGSLGQMAAAAPFKPVVTSTRHYDPVRGSQPPQGNHAVETDNWATTWNSTHGQPLHIRGPYATANPQAALPSSFPARPDHSTKWDAPSRTSVDDFFHGANGPQQPPHQFEYYASGSPFANYNCCGTSSFFDSPSAPAPTYQATKPKPLKKVHIKDLVEDRAVLSEEGSAPSMTHGLKRKADDISANDMQRDPWAEAARAFGVTIQSSILPGNLTSIVQLPGMHNVPDAAPMATLQPQACTRIAAPQVPTQVQDIPPPVKRTKLLPKPSNKNLVKEAIGRAATVGGYMALGGALTVAFLASPAADSLLGAL